MATRHWPEWLTNGDAKIVERLQVIGDICERILAESAEEYTYTHLLQRAVNEFTDRMIKHKVFVKDSDGRYTHVLNNPENRTRMSAADNLLGFNNTSASYRMLCTLLASEKIAVAKFARGFRDGLGAGDLLIPMVCARCIVEHSALLHKLLKDVEQVQVPENFEEAGRILPTVYGIVGQKVYATRVDWDSLLTQTADDVLAEGKIKYEAKEDRIDREAKGLMNAIDHLAKQVQGVRAVYEILCEFAHPNIGNLMINCNEVHCYKDSLGMPWVQKTIGMSPPIAFVEITKLVLSKVIEVLANTLVRFEHLMNIDGPEQKEKVLRITQLVVREVAAKNRNNIDPYYMCPCGSGKKMKFCCLVTSPDLETT